MVVKKFWSAIPERRLVLVPLEDKFRAALEAVALAEVFGHTSHEEIGALAGHMKNPREHRGGSGFPMRAADDDGVAIRQKDFFENFRHRAKIGRASCRERV